ncbi:hypothetical protein PTSG_05682 [Salpingoeca rosetta]|uniref:non-specific serine/threonine protein kinase n=1 Tax=Salpingoeca rosetta (strain ATCC 50818 / BSB-021) TaxID=946362 RepID=F2UBX1_SALR5|nr:uncharacterized protein PTSG_05682 [Salpingoeca rosetta]EGD73987.1 hypothetical protein PTSG_05682 [Salpingoeca rosetta]|eukprot:XP_004993550.1 hypothetical protein PTSG_05682 [Salpingoeca rosetta]
MASSSRVTREKLEAMIAALQLGEDGKNEIRAIADGTCGPAVTLGFVSLDSQGATVIAHALRQNTCVKLLGLGHNCIGPDGAKALANMLASNKTITILRLQSNRIGNEGAIALADVLCRNKSVTELRLHHNNIGLAGAEALANMLRTNATITHVSLFANSIGHKGAQALAEMLKDSTTLTHLKLGENAIGDAGVEALAKALETDNSTLQVLWLNCNGLSDSSAVALANMLRRNKAVTTLGLDINTITPGGGAELGASLHENHSLRVLTLSHNSTATARAFGAAVPVHREIWTGKWEKDPEGQVAFNEGREVNRQQQQQLFDACKHGNVQLVTSLINEDHVRLDQQNEEGDTPLHLAYRHNQQAIVSLLRKCRVDETIKNGKGELPHDAAFPPAEDTPMTQRDPQHQAQREADVMAAMHQIALHSDTQMAGRAKLMLVGQGRAGKTTTLNSLMGAAFNRDEHSTFGAETTDLSVIVESMDVCDWKRVRSDLSEYMRTLRDAGLAKTTGMDVAMRVAMMKAVKEREQRVHQQQQQQQQQQQGVEHVSSDEEEREDEEEDEVLREPEEATAVHEAEKRDTCRSKQPARARRPNKRRSWSNSSVPSSRRRDMKHRRNYSTSTMPSQSVVPSEEMEKAIKDLHLDVTMGEGKARVTFKVFDLGGQSTFYIFHPFFLTENAVYLLVFSMEDLLHPNPSKRAEAWEFINYWLSSLHLHAKGAPVLMVGTFADNVTSNKLQEGISPELYRRFRCHPAFPSVVRNDKHGLWFWPVDNTKSINDPMIQDLRQTISTTALKQPFVNQDVPVAYIKVYDELMATYKEQGRDLMAMDEVEAITRKHGLITKHDARMCMQYLGLYSLVLYFHDIGDMHNFVILSPQWAVDMMARVIRNFDLHRGAHDQEAVKVGAHLWDDLVQRGILHRRVLDVLWQDMRADMVEPFLRLMIEYGLCVECEDARPLADCTKSPHGTQKQPKHQQSRKFLIPAILPMRLDTPPNDFGSSVTLSATAAKLAHPYAGYEANTVYLSFFLNGDHVTRTARMTVDAIRHKSFLPEGIFTLLLAHILGRIGHDCSYSQEPKLSRTHAIIDIGTASRVELQLVPAVGGIKIHVEGPQPHELVKQLSAMISVAMPERYHRDLQTYLLLPFDHTSLLSFDSAAQCRTERMRLGDDFVSISEITDKFGSLLPPRPWNSAPPATLAGADTIRRVKAVTSEALGPPPYARQEEEDEEEEEYFDQTLTAWLKQLRLLPRVREALNHHGIKSLATLVTMVQRGKFTAATLEASGVAPAHAIELISQARTFGGPQA